MKQLKKGLLALLVGVFGLLSVNAQTNLFENGDFKNGTTGWFLSGFELGSEGDYALVETGYYSEYYAPTIKTENQTVEGLSGNTYTFSLWAKNLKAENLTINIKLKDAKNNDLYDSQIGMSRTFQLDVEDDQGAWKKLSKTITFPENVAKLTEFRITFGGNDYNYKAVSEISMIKKVSAPQNFKVNDNTLSQRSTELTWDAVDGKEYKVKIGDMEYSSTKGSLVVHGLLPATNYIAEVYTTDAEDLKTTLDFTTKNYIAKEGERVPFLANIEDNKIDAKFMYDINDLEGGAIEGIEVTLNDLPATIQDGYVILPETTNGKLIVNITQNDGEKTTLTYYSITIKK